MDAGNLLKPLLARPGLVPPGRTRTSSRRCTSPRGYQTSPADSPEWKPGPARPLLWRRCTVAQALAQEYGNPQIEQIHLLCALLEDENGLVPQLSGCTGTCLGRVRVRIPFS